VSYRPTAPETEQARGRLARAGFQAAQPLVGLQVASFPTRPYRDWPIEQFAELCKRITASWPRARFLIFGGAEERRRTGWLRQRLGERAELYAGRLSLRETAALMSLCQLYVGVDTGPTHIMSAFDTPLVAMYHCTGRARLTGPLEHPRAVLIDHPHSAEQCTERSAMAEIPVEAVYDAVRQALAGAARS
jgi:heptosyltransferase-3